MVSELSINRQLHIYSFKMVKEDIILPERTFNYVGAQYSSYKVLCYLFVCKFIYLFWSLYYYGTM